MTTATAPATVRVRTADSLRTLYFTRTVFSAIWVTLVFVLASTVTTGARPTAIAVVLLTIYPAWDAVATFFDVRATAAATSHLPQYLNIAIGLLAAVGILLAIGTGLTPALIVFGVWACISGAVQLYLGLRRRRPIGGQWPMIISGGISVLAGGVFIATASAYHPALTSAIAYVIPGAIFFLISAIRLGRPAKGN